MNAPVRGSRIRLSPWQESGTFQDRINRLLDLPSPSLLSQPRRERVFLVRLVEGDREYVLRAELPGTTPEDVELEGARVALEDGLLIVRVPKRLGT